MSFKISICGEWKSAVGCQREAEFMRERSTVVCMIGLTMLAWTNLVTVGKIDCKLGSYGKKHENFSDLIYY